MFGGTNRLQCSTEFDFQKISIKYATGGHKVFNGERYVDNLMKAGMQKINDNNTEIRFKLLLIRFIANRTTSVTSRISWF